ncbi:MAG: hypothetical protein QXG44_11335 [Candidatus Jordarchaeaceae archaeon]
MKLKKLAVANSGPLIHLAKAGLLELLDLYDTVVPTEIEREVVAVGKEKGYGNALQVEEAVKKGLVKVVEVKASKKLTRLAEHAGIHEAEMRVIYYTLRNSAVALLDDEAARSFARNLGVEVRGSLGLLLEGLKSNVITYNKALEGLDKLSEIMYLSSDIYKEVLSKIKSLIEKTNNDNDAQNSNPQKMRTFISNECFPFNKLTQGNNSAR